MSLEWEYVKVRLTINDEVRKLSLNYRYGKVAVVKFNYLFWFVVDCRIQFIHQIYLSSLASLSSWQNAAIVPAHIVNLTIFTYTFYLQFTYFYHNDFYCEWVFVDVWLLFFFEWIFLIQHSLFLHTVLSLSLKLTVFLYRIFTVKVQVLASNAVEYVRRKCSQYEVIKIYRDLYKWLIREVVNYHLP